MSVVAVALLTVHDEDRYKRYVRAFPAVLARFDGEILAADSAEVIEGDFEQRRLVVLRFPSRQGFDDWYNSPEYQAIVNDRLASGTSVVLRVEGLDSRGVRSTT